MLLHALRCDHRLILEMCAIIGRKGRFKLNPMLFCSEREAVSDEEDRDEDGDRSGGGKAGSQQQPPKKRQPAAAPDGAVKARKPKRSGTFS